MLWRVVVNDSASEWGPVISSVHQGSFLALILFAIYVNNINEGNVFRTSMFAFNINFNSSVVSCRNVQKFHDNFCRLRGWPISGKCHLMWPKAKLCTSVTTFFREIQGHALKGRLWKSTWELSLLLTSILRSSASLFTICIAMKERKQKMLQINKVASILYKIGEKRLTLSKWEKI